MFGTFTVAIDGSDELYRGADTLYERHDTRELLHCFLVNDPQAL